MEWSMLEADNKKNCCPILKMPMPCLSCYCLQVSDERSEIKLDYSLDIFEVKIQKKNRL